MRIAALLAVLALVACGEEEPPAQAPDAGRVLAADDHSFERIAVEPDGDVLVLLYATWSAPDRIVLEHAAAVARERPDLRVVKVDVDRSPDTARRYKVLAVPTAVILNGGEQQGDPVTGALPKARWERKLGL